VAIPQRENGGVPGNCGAQTIYWPAIFLFSFIFPCAKRTHRPSFTVLLYIVAGVKGKIKKKKERSVRERQ
jgi:hypothetical protein